MPLLASMRPVATKQTKQICTGSKFGLRARQENPSNRRKSTAMSLPLKVKAKMREPLFVDGNRAKVTMSDISGSTSDKFNPNVSAGPQCSQEFFPFKGATAESSCLCYVIHGDNMSH